MLDHLDARAGRRWALAALAELGDQRGEIDRSNVFPVADGDTGTNLLLTLEAGVAAVEQNPAAADCLSELAAVFARGALLGARGNSGVILAQFIRAWAQVLAEHQVADAATVREALGRGAAGAWAAVSRPVEGTMLSVARAASDGAAGSTLAEVVTAAAAAAGAALERTTGQLDALARAGVVDAGGRGLLVLLDTLAEVVTGVSPGRRRRPWTRPRPPAVAGSEPDGPAYEVVYLLDAGDEAVADLRTRLDGLGESLTVAGGEGLWTVHVHTDDVAGALEAGLAAGRPHRLAVTRLDGPPRARPGEPGPLLVLATARGPGLAALLGASGAVVVGPVGGRPSTLQLIQALRAAAGSRVVLLPDGPHALAVAGAAAGVARGEGQQVTVLPTRAAVQALAALAVHDPGAARDDDLVRMAAAAASTRHGSVRTAAVDTATPVGPCRVGQTLGLVGGDVVEVGDDPEKVALSVVSRMLSAGGELLTLVWGSAPRSRALAEAVAGSVRRERGDVEVSVVDGGQAGEALLLGVE